MEEVREGLTVLHEPSDPNVPTADVVFVHGLGGDPQKTWTSTVERRPEPPDQQDSSKTSVAQSSSSGLLAWAFHRQSSEEPPPSSNSEQLFWPKDFLAMDVPDVRILTYGYDSAVTKGYTSSSKSGIFALSRNLLYKLERERPRGRPIIFVAHSLGGIITKEVLRRSESSEEQEFQDIVNSTKGVIFFGTPHRGSPGFADLGAIVRRVAENTLRVDTNSSILRALGVDQPELEEGRVSFTKQWRKFDFLVKTFQEDYGLSGINLSLLNEKVVPDASSFLDDEREHAETIPANHMEMCKFSSRQDPGYQAVCAEIRRVLRRLDRQEPQFTKDQAEGFLKSLHFSTMYDRAMDVAEALRDTCNWFFALPEYQSWIQGRVPNDNSSLLWIKGKPGAGKSTLMKDIFRRIKPSADRQSTTVAAFFFNGKATNSLEKTQMGLYRSILHQILKADHTALRRSIPAYLQKKGTEKLENDQVRWHREELQKLLLERHAYPGLVPVFILVDALDECSRDEVRNVISFFRHLTERATQAGNAVNICFSSRHYPNLEIRRCSEVHVENHNRNDIFRYVQHQAECINAVQELQEELVTKASNVFLWVVLAIGILDRRGRGKSVKSRRKLLDRLPPELSTLFSDLFSDLEDDERPEILLLFQWILFANKPLTTAQIIYAICFGSESPPVSLAQLKESEHYVAEDKRSEYITALSRGLIELKTSPASVEESHYDPYSNGQPRLQLVHESVRDFFLYENGFASLFASTVPFHEVIGRAHSAIARSCANALLFPEGEVEIPWLVTEVLERGLLEFSAHPLQNYAFTNVLNHVNTAEDRGIPQTETLHKLQNQLDKFGTSWKFSLLHQACKTGLLSCASKLIKIGADVNTTNELGYTTLYSACRNYNMGDASVVRLLLRHGADPNDRGSDGKPPLIMTSEDDDKLQATDALLDNGADPNAVDSSHRTALYEADRLSAERLIRAGALVNWRDQWGRTVLHQKLSIQRLDFFLRAGADASAAIDSLGRTPMHYLDDSYESFEKMKILTRHGADPNTQSINGQTPLHVQVTAGSPLASLALITTGASVNIRDDIGLSALDLAFSAHRHHRRRLKMLTISCIVIAAGADAYVKDHKGISPAEKWEKLKIELQTPNSLGEHFSPENIHVVTRALKRGRCPELLDSIMGLSEEELDHAFHNGDSEFESTWWRVVCSVYDPLNE